MDRMDGYQSLPIFTKNSFCINDSNTGYFSFALPWLLLVASEDSSDLLQLAQTGVSSQLLQSPGALTEAQMRCPHNSGIYLPGP